MNINDLTNKLKEKNIKVSFQRIKVLEYLNNNRTHPTVDQIYNDLHLEITSLSRTTIYNTLNALVESGLVKLITIDDNTSRYDIDTRNHGHFKCQTCKNIYDFKVNIDSLSEKELKDFEINSKDVYFKGICPNCSI
ncbi:MAG TPA: transcriptional repressor [Clostridiales bacterium]|nr:transcriptional repressor [Clostridiales bacterium]